MDLQIWVSQNWGYLIGGPHNKDYSIWGSILGSPYFGKLPNISGVEPPTLGYCVRLRDHEENLWTLLEGLKRRATECSGGLCQSGTQKIRPYPYADLLDGMWSLGLLHLLPHTHCGRTYSSHCEMALFPLCLMLSLICPRYV